MLNFRIYQITASEQGLWLPALGTWRLRSVNDLRYLQGDRGFSRFFYAECRFAAMFRNQSCGS
jgi:hypothetical protein